MVMNQLGSGSQVAIKLPDTKANVCIVTEQVVLMLKWDDDIAYHIALIDCAQNHTKIEIKYSLRPNSHSSIQSRVTLISVNSLSEIESLKKLAYLRLDVQEISITRNDGEHDELDGASRFIGNLFIQ